MILINDGNISYFLLVEWMLMGRNDKKQEEERKKHKLQSSPLQKIEKYQYRVCSSVSSYYTSMALEFLMIAWWRVKKTLK
jgi:hypothetical protein